MRRRMCNSKLCRRCRLQLLVPPHLGAAGAVVEPPLALGIVLEGACAGALGGAVVILVMGVAGRACESPTWGGSRPALVDNQRCRALPWRSWGVWCCMRARGEGRKLTACLARVAGEVEPGVAHVAGEPVGGGLLAAPADAAAVAGEVPRVRLTRCFAHGREAQGS